VKIEGGTLRKLILSATIATVILALPGVAGPAASAQSITPGAPKSGTVSIQLFNYYTGPQEQAITGAVSAFEKAYPTVKVVVDDVPGQNAVQKLVSLEAANQTPNIVVIDQSNIYEFYPKLVPLKNVFSTAFINKFDQGGLNSATYNHVQYGVQVLGANDTALIYNKQDFKAAGISSPPTTWAQLLTDAKTLTVPSANRYGIGVSGIQTEESTWQFLPFMWSNGGQLGHLNSPASIQALQFWDTLVQDKVMPSAAVDWTQGDVQNHFEVNDLAMEINGPWNVPCLNKPSVCGGSVAPTSAAISWAVAPIPTRLPGQKLIVPIGGETWEIGQGTPAQEAASALFIQYLSDNTQLNVRLTNLMSYMPAIKTETAAYDKAYPAFAAWASELQNGIPRMYANGKYGAVSALIQVAIGKVLSGSETPQAALATAAAGVTTIK
jgi:multiple sugar transport system substrate-binding protein